MKLQDAMDIATNLKYGPMGNVNKPSPTYEEAYALIEAEWKDCWFNWITGQEALKLIGQALSQKRGNMSNKGAKR